jgi:CubicO group peptidase (beta-lactamase class C family)
MKKFHDNCVKGIFMNRPVKFFIVIAVFFWVASGMAFAQAGAKETLPDPYREAITTARMEIWKAIGSGMTSSATVAIIDNGRIIYSEGFGMRDRANSIPVDTHTQYNIGSVSKVFTAAAILLLVQDGKVELDAPVTTYLPEFVMRDARYKDITVRMLLNHTSGFPGTLMKDGFGSEKNPNYVADTMSYLATSSLKHDPGELSVYCNDGFTLAEGIIERVSGMSFSSFVASRIFAKFGMNDSSCFFKDGNENRALVYDPDTGKAKPLEFVSILGSGGISSTAEDLCRFSTVLSGTSFFGPSLLSELEKPQYGPHTTPEGAPLYQYGLGWDTVTLDAFQKQGITVLAKNGGTLQYSSELYVVPGKKIALAVIVAGHANVGGILDEVLQALLEGKGVVPRKALTVRLPLQGKAMPEGLLRFEGYYGSRGSLLKVTFDKDKNSLSYFKYDNGSFSLIREYPYSEDGRFHVDGQQSLSFSEKFGKKYILVHINGSDDNIVSAENLEQAARGIDVSAFAKKTWLPRNVSAFDFFASASHSDSIVELPGYIVFDGVPYKLSDTMTADMSLKYVRDQGSPRISMKKDSPWLSFNGVEYSDASALSGLESGGSIAIGANGFSEWRKASSARVFSAAIPKSGRILVITPGEEILYDSLMDGSKDIVLPEGSYVGFIGPVGAEFSLR